MPPDKPQPCLEVWEFARARVGASRNSRNPSETGPIATRSRRVSAEWKTVLHRGRFASSTALVLKTVGRREASRGFESLPLRSQAGIRSPAAKIGAAWGARGRPFDPSTINNRAATAWKKAKLGPIGLHECRHTYAAFMIAAGVNAKALSTYMGHSSIVVTLDRYGHLMPGNEREAASMLATYLEDALASGS